MNDHTHLRLQIPHALFEGHKQRCSYTRRLSGTTGYTRGIVWRQTFSSSIHDFFKQNCNSYKKNELEFTQTDYE